MAHPLTRVLTLLELLQSQPGRTGTELADRLGTDVRTVRRYTAHLRDLGIPVEAERGRYGGYRLARGYRMPPLVLSNDEALAVVLGLVAAQRVGMGTTLATAGALAKIERVLPQALRDPLTAVRESVSFTAHPVTADAPAAGIVLALAGAAHHRTTVGVTYESWKQQRSERDVDPYGVVFHNGRWYLVGRDHLRGGVRVFRVDRIGSVVHRGGNFTAPDGFDAAEHVTSALAQVPYRWDVEVAIHGPFEAITRRVPRSAATLAPDPTGVIMRARADRLDGMAHLLASLEWPFTIHRPDELRHALQKLADQLSDAAQRKPTAPA
jgi:predicted DNA-binding transcriptional regulator YafY